MVNIIKFSISLFVFILDCSLPQTERFESIGGVSL